MRAEQEPNPTQAGDTSCLDQLARSPHRHVSQPTSSGPVFGHLGQLRHPPFLALPASSCFFCFGPMRLDAAHPSPIEVMHPSSEREKRTHRTVLERRTRGRRSLLLALTRHVRPLWRSSLALSRPNSGAQSKFQSCFFLQPSYCTIQYDITHILLSIVVVR